ncbi:MAG: hypothetical protein ACXWYP_09645 [Pseudonocardia sp.]
MNYYLGIDVGAARASAAVARAGSDDVEPVDLGDGGCGVASVLHLGADGGLDVGVAAERWADDEPDRVVRGFPGRIGDDVPMLLAGEPWAPEELTAWLVRWVVDRVAESEGGLAEAVAVTRPASWDADRTELLAGALAEQDLDATFLTTARAVEWHSDGSGTDGAAAVASAAACGAALALRAGGAGSDGADDVAARLAALAQFPSSDNGSPTAVSDADDGLPGSAEVPAPRSHRSGGWPAVASGAHAAVDRGEGDQAEGDRAEGDRAEGGPVDGFGAHRAGGDGAEGDPVDGSGAHRAGGSTTTDEPEDALFAALGGFTGTLGATNTAGLLSGYTPPSGLATTGQATALVTDAGEQLALPTQRSGSGKWAAVPDVDEADELEPDPAPTPARLPERSPTVLVTIGGAAAAVAVIATLFLWPAPRTTNSAINRPAPLVPALTSPAEPTSDLTLTPTATPTPTPRPRPPARTRRPAAPPAIVETTPAPSVTTEPTEPTATSEPQPSESTAPPTTTDKPDDD